MKKMQSTLSNFCLFLLLCAGLSAEISVTQIDSLKEDQTRIQVKSEDFRYMAWGVEVHNLLAGFTPYKVVKVPSDEFVFSLTKVQLEDVTTISAFLEYEGSVFYDNKQFTSGGMDKEDLSKYITTESVGEDVKKVIFGQTAEGESMRPPRIKYVYVCYFAKNIEDLESSIKLSKLCLNWTWNAQEL